MRVERGVGATEGRREPGAPGLIPLHVPLSCQPVCGASIAVVFSGSSLYYIGGRGAILKPGEGGGTLTEGNEVNEEEQELIVSGNKKTN